MNQENKDILALVVNTLNQIEVKGEDNFDMMLGCIRTLKQVIKGDDTSGGTNTEAN